MQILAGMGFLSSTACVKFFQAEMQLPYLISHQSKLILSMQYVLKGCCKNLRGVYHFGVSELIKITKKKLPVSN